MASTDLVTAANRPIYIGDVESNRPNSESINQKLAGGLNFVLERLYLDMKFPYPGYVYANNFDDGYGGIEIIENDCEISRYFLAIHKTGTAGVTSFNVNVYDNTGAFVNTLFGSGGNALSISGSNGTNVVVGKERLDTASPANILVNTAGHSVFTGNLNLTTLLAGYVLVPYIVSHGTDTLNLNFGLRCKEL